MKITTKPEIQLCIGALRPILLVRHPHYLDVEELLRTEYPKQVQVFDLARGWLSENGQDATPVDAMSFLKGVNVYKMATIVVLRDAHHVLDDHKVVAQLRSLAENSNNTDEPKTVVLLSPVVKIPQEIEHLTTIIEVERLRDEGIGRIIEQFADSQGTQVSSETLSLLVAECRGLSRFDIEQILRTAFMKEGVLKAKNREDVQEEKRLTIRKTGLLELIKIEDGLDELGGLNNLKPWIQRKARIFEKLDVAEKACVDPPRGVLIVGMPGCGKSLAAKATANEFKVPLLRLDVGRLLGKFVGESEDNLRRALDIAESISPCVLWIDEIEKAFAGAGADDGGGAVTTRLVGHFLTWMQERTRPVFVVATANDVARLPPEFFRRGRFDETFSVDLPVFEERREILRIHLRKRRITLGTTNEIVKSTEGYSGADLEALVKEALEVAFLDNNRPVTEADLLKAKATLPGYAQTFADRVKAARDKLKEYGVRPA